MDSYPYPHFAYTSDGIRLNAPEAPGVYVVFNEEGPLAVIAAEFAIRSQMLLSLPFNHMEPWGPVAFTYELVPPRFCLGRQNQLIQRLRPKCQSN